MRGFELPCERLHVQTSTCFNLGRVMLSRNYVPLRMLFILQREMFRNRTPHFEQFGAAGCNVDQSRVHLRFGGGKVKTHPTETTRVGESQCHRGVKNSQRTMRVLDRTMLSPLRAGILCILPWMCRIMFLTSIGKISPPRRRWSD